MRAGQPSAVKIESFPFTKYGLIQGEVLHVSADAIQDKERGLVYAARIALKEKRILVGERWIPLGPGLTVSAEIKTGAAPSSMSPFIRYTDEALRER